MSLGFKLGLRVSGFEAGGLFRGSEFGGFAWKQALGVWSFGCWRYGVG